MYATLTKGMDMQESHLTLQSRKYKISWHLSVLDYCDTCAQFAEKIRAKQTTLNRLQHTGSSDDERLKPLKESIEELHLDLEAPKLMAKKSHEYHLEMVKRCTTQWKRIAKERQC